MIGGHKGSDITCVAFSSMFGIIASGSSNGLIAVWDFELAKLEAALFGHTKDISSLKFVEPYPLLVSCSNSGELFIWGIRPICLQKRNICFVKLQNWTVFKGGDELTPINCVLTKIEQQVEGMHKKKRGHYNLIQDRNSQIWKFEEGEVLQTNAGIDDYVFIYVADDKGWIKVLEISELLQTHAI